VLDLQIKSNSIKKLQEFKEKYMELKKTSKEQSEIKERDICQYQKKLEHYTECLLQKNLEVKNLFIESLTQFRQTL